MPSNGELSVPCRHSRGASTTFSKIRYGPFFFFPHRPKTHKKWLYRIMKLEYTCQIFWKIFSWLARYSWPDPRGNYRFYRERTIIWFLSEGSREVTSRFSASSAKFGSFFFLSLAAYLNCAVGESCGTVATLTYTFALLDVMPPFVRNDVGFEWNYLGKRRWKKLFIFYIYPIYQENYEIFRRPIKIFITWCQLHPVYFSQQKSLYIVQMSGQCFLLISIL